MDIKKVAVYVIVVFVLWLIIAFPDRATEFVGIGFNGISSGAYSVGDFMSELVN